MFTATLKNGEEYKYDSFTSYLERPPLHQTMMHPDDIRIEGNQLPKLEMPKAKPYSGPMGLG